MIIRKPYAFLIKNFRLIHFVMLLIAGFVLYKTNNALSFFNDYVATRQFIQSDTLINDTVPIIMAIFSFILIIGSVSIVVLFRKKDKPTLFYIASIIFYMAFIVIVIISRGLLTDIILDGIDPRISRMIRDIWLISLILQIILVVFYLIRALGFDIKKFNFGEDIHEFKIEDEDSEEFELTTKFDADKAKMRAAMRREEWKSFYFENRFMIILMLFLLLIVIPGAFVAKNIIDNKKYAENEVIKFDNLEFKVVETYVTKKNYKGESIYSNDNSFLIVKFNLNDVTGNEKGIKLNNLRIESHGTVYQPNTTYYESFTDIGKGYVAQTVSKSSKDYIAVYIVKDSDLQVDEKNNIILRYTDRISVKNNEAKANYYRIIINPKNIDNNVKTTNLEIGDELKITGTNMKLTHFNIKDKFTYELNNKSKYIVNPVGLVLLINYEYANGNNIKIGEFLNTYSKIKYTIDDKTYTENIKDITPSNYNKNELYLAVSENIKDAESINLVIRLRTVEYVYKIK